jgi:competence protein ComEA
MGLGQNFVEREVVIMMNEPQLYGHQQWEREMLAIQPTEVQRAVVFTAPLLPDTPPSASARLNAKVAAFLHKKGRAACVVIIILILITAITIYFTWFGSQQDSSSSTGGSVQTATTQNFSATATSSKTTATDTTTTGDGGSIQVYIVGAVKRPGVYTLDTNARVYQVLKAAGGPLADANLVAVNLAASLKDGEEIYIPKVGEQIPANVDGAGSSTGTTGRALTPVASGALVNINTASEVEMRQQLHVSAKTAQAIISYRMQHGNYTSVDQLANAVSKTIYDRIKGMVTV